MERFVLYATKIMLWVSSNILQYVSYCTILPYPIYHWYNRVPRKRTLKVLKRVTANIDFHKYHGLASILSFDCFWVSIRFVAIRDKLLFYFSYHVIFVYLIRKSVTFQKFKWIKLNLQILLTTHFKLVQILVCMARADLDIKIDVWWEL